MSPASRQLQLSKRVAVDLVSGDLTAVAECMPRRCFAAVTLTTLTLLDIDDFTDAVSGGTRASGGVLALLMPWPALSRAWDIGLSRYVLCVWDGWCCCCCSCSKDWGSFIWRYDNWSIEVMFAKPSSISLSSSSWPSCWTVTLLLWCKLCMRQRTAFSSWAGFSEAGTSIVDCGICVLIITENFSSFPERGVCPLHRPGAYWHTQTSVPCSSPYQFQETPWTASKWCCHCAWISDRWTRHTNCCSHTLEISADH